MIARVDSSTFLRRVTSHWIRSRWAPSLLLVEDTGVDAKARSAAALFHPTMSMSLFPFVCRRKGVAIVATTKPATDLCVKACTKLALKARIVDKDMSFESVVVKNLD